MLLGDHDALPLSLAAEGSEMVIPIGEQDQRQTVFTQMLFCKVHAAKQMLPQRG